VPDGPVGWTGRPPVTRILVVEDDHKVGRVLEQGLREADFEVDRVTDGLEALARAQVQDYDLILLDHMLPGRSGMEVASELRARGRRLPILMLSARDTPEDRHDYLAAGVNDVLGKPFRFDDLIQRINELLATAR
jgi:two-component system copper resistance phosphate regulon response regulator CusR